MGLGFRAQKRALSASGRESGLVYVFGSHYIISVISLVDPAERKAPTRRGLLPCTEPTWSFHLLTKPFTELV